MKLKKQAKYILTLLIASIITQQAFSATSSILSTSVRKVSDSALNLTFYTNGDTSEKPIVKDKGGNQYVVLLPNYTDSSKNIDLKAVSDIVSDYDVKTINEGAITYTKVSLKTQKPVKVNVQTRKTSQSASELSGMNDIISKVNLINKDIKSAQKLQETKPAQNTTVAQQPANAVNFPKMNNVADILKNKNSFTAIPATKKEEQKPTVTPTPIVKSENLDAHVPAVTKTVNKQNKNKLVNENIKNVRTESVKKLEKLEDNIKIAEQNNVVLENKNEAVENNSQPENNYDENIIETEPLPDIDTDINLPPLPGESFASKIHKFLTSPLAIVFGILLLGMLATIAVVKSIKKLLAGSNEIDNSFIERMNLGTPTSQNRKRPEDIANDENLNWQEKYATYKHNDINSTISDVTDNYGDEDLDLAEKTTEVQTHNKNYNFEQTKRSYIKNTDYMDSPFAQDIVDEIDVQSSEKAITKAMKRELTGFQDSRSLKHVIRNSGITNRFSRFDTKAQVKRNVNELLDTIIQLDEEKKSKTLANEVANNLTKQALHTEKKVVKIAPKMPAKPAVSRKENNVEKISSPITDTKKKLKITKSRAIDDNRGFYLVDMDDKLALMGRIKDKFVVLKKFDDKEKSTLQVRRDKDNLYMVRTDGFKALVDVEDEKMGVLAEL